MEKHEQIILQQISERSNVAEGPESIREVLMQIYRQKNIKNKILSQLTQIPVPTLSAIRGELIKAGILESITSFTANGLRFAEEKLGFQLSPFPYSLNYINEFSTEAFPENVLSKDKIGKLKNFLKLRPESDVQLDQSMATFETQLKRLALLLLKGDVEGRNMLFIGDDDATSVMVSATGLAKRIVVIDIDERILSFLTSLPTELQKTKLETYKYDIRNPIPKNLNQKFDIVFTDPPYTLQGAKLFFQRGMYALRSEGTKFYISFGPKQPFTVWNLQLQIMNFGFILNEVLSSFNKYQGNLRLGQFSNLFVFKLLHSPNILSNHIPQKYTKKMYTAELKNSFINESSFPIEGRENLSSIGYHLIVEMYGLTSKIIFEPSELYKETLRLCIANELHVIDSYLYIYPPQGLSIIITLAESHIGLHTWPEHDYLSLDVFICDDPEKAHKFVNEMKNLIKPEKVEEIIINRGLDRKN